ncbi:hypothetical protein FUA23_06555 [Neolewinella aurantiaca]|uniref:SH3 domain-containing protein n=1 Tax=Neolewinella aurantiaca TaxID=2602767 RepID=A0A5C7FKG8_9BACT|nr:hypothetical protein [Neolewinella aurantiaca]TXF90446.1 hypothetical protein FUA23_06555 [Neolewinella aurantiaca]
MKHLLLTASLLLLSTSFLMGYDVEYTVMAQSGLQLREGPEIDSKVLVSIPFGKHVLGKGMPFDVQQYYEYGELDAIDAKYRFTSEGLNGFWHHVSFEDIEGFVFSGYLIRGSFITEPNDTLSYVMFEHGFSCDPIEFSNNYNYYELSHTSDSIKLREIYIQFELRQHFSTELKEKYDDIWFNFPFRIIVNSEFGNSFILGSANKLETYEDENLLNEYQSGYNDRCKEFGFLYPEQTYKFYYRNTNHVLRGVAFVDANDSKNEIKYGISYSVTNRSFNLNEIPLELRGQQSLRRHADFNTPIIILVTDVNQDGILDVLIASHTMTESCGICWYKDLYISERGKNITIRHASRSTVCNCVT